MIHLCSWIYASTAVWLLSHNRHLKTKYKQLIFSSQSAPSLFLKSNFEYLRGNYRKAVKLLNSSNIAEHPGFMKTGKRKLWNSSIVFLALKSLLLFVSSSALQYDFCWFFKKWNVLLFLLQKILKNLFIICFHFIL